MRIRDLDRVLADLKPFLAQYLDEHGHGIHRRTKRFTCLNADAHRNGDKDPSASFVRGTNQTIWHCFACGERGTIVHAAYWLEGMAVRGPDFSETVRTLCDRYHVRYEDDEQLQRRVSANLQVSTLVARGREHKTVQEYIASRGWTTVAERFGLGYANVDKLAKLLRGSVPDEILEQGDFLRKTLMHDRLLWPIRDVSGDVVGFASRTISPNDDRPRYINSDDNGLYRKSETLYNLDSVSGDEAWLVEGYADVWTMAAHGIDAVATCGTAMSDAQRVALADAGIKRLIVCMDGDKAGQDATKRIVEMLETQGDFRVWVVALPSDKAEKDPDSYITMHGAKRLMELPRQEVSTSTTRLLSNTRERIIAWDESCWEGVNRGYEMSAWPYLTEQLDGWQAGTYLLSAVPNVGKTHFLLRTLDTLVAENDVLAILFSFDDTATRMYARLVASKANLPINTVSDPQRHIVERYEATNPDEMTRRMESRQRGLEQVLDRSAKFLIFDADDGRDLGYIRKTVAAVQEMTGRNLVVGIDSLNKVLSDRPILNETERERYVSQELKDLQKRYRMPLIMTAEMSKRQGRLEPDNQDLRGAVNLEYDADVIFLLYNDLHHKGDDAQMVFEIGGNKMPVVQLEVGKNKLSEFKGRDYFRVYPHLSRVDECNADERRHWSQVRKGGSKP